MYSYVVAYCHCNGHVGLCDCVHGAADERCLQSDLLGECRGEILCVCVCVCV